MYPESSGTSFHSVSWTKQSLQKILGGRNIFLHERHTAAWIFPCFRSCRKRSPATPAVYFHSSGMWSLHVRRSRLFVIFSKQDSPLFCDRLEILNVENRTHPFFYGFPDSFHL